MINKNIFTVGELAKAMDVTVRTLQYYDKEGLLPPSSTSEGGRRLYSKKDMVKLHQIKSFKSLGFSLGEIKEMLLELDTPTKVANVLKRQSEAVADQIKTLETALFSINALQEEVLKINKVDFEKYADILFLIKENNKDYWVMALFDKSLSTHVKEKFMNNPEQAVEIKRNYDRMVEEALLLKRSDEPPNSEKSMKLAKRWWDMVMKFTGGDKTMLPKLEEFNLDKSNWDDSMASKQKEIDEFLELILSNYFMKESIIYHGMEEIDESHNG